MKTRRLLSTGLTVLSVMLGGQALITSQAMAVVKHSLAFKVTGTPAGQFGGPGGIAVASNGTIYVADWYAYEFGRPDAVDEFTSGGEYIGQITGTPNGPFAEFSPFGVAIDSAGNLYVADAGNHVVDKFNSAGQYQSQLTGPMGGAFQRPVNVAVDLRDDSVYVTDEGADAVYKFSSTGVYQSQITEAAGNAFGSVSGVAVAPNGNVYIVDGANGVIDEFDATGAYLSDLAGTPNGSFQGPHSVAVDPSGNVYVDDRGNGRVDEFDAAGSYLTELSGAPGEPFEDPYDVGTDASGRLYVDGQSFGLDAFEPGVLVPYVSTGEASDLQVGSTSPVLEGTINPEGIESSYYFEYGTTTSYGSESPAAPGTSVGSGETPVTVQTSLSGLLPNTTYHYRLDGADANGVNNGEDKTFTTRVVPVTNDALPVASHLTRDGRLLLTGTVNPENLPTTYHFVYGTTTSYGMRTPDERQAGAGMTDTSVSDTLEGLVPDTTYHFAVVATNAIGSSTSEDATFTMPTAAPPTAVTGFATGITHATATLAGTVDPNGISTSYQFEYGTTTGYGTSVFGDAGSSPGAATVTVSLQGLGYGTTYHYRLVAHNADGISYGSDETFTTAGFPEAFGVPALPPFVTAPAIAFPSEGAKVTRRHVKRPKHRVRRHKSHSRRKHKKK